MSKKNEKRKASRKKIVDVEKALTKGPLDARKANVEKALKKPPTVKQENARRIAERSGTLPIKVTDGVNRAAAKRATEAGEEDPNEEKPCFLCEPANGPDADTPMVKRKDGYCFGCREFICDKHQGNTPLGSHDPEAHDDTDEEEDLPPEAFDAD